MIKTRVLFVLLCLSHICLAQKSVGYEITGNVKNIPSNWVFLRTIKYNRFEKSYGAVIDSARVINGHFILNRDTVLLEPSWASSISYIDSVTNKVQTLGFKNPFKDVRNGGLFLDNAKIIISGDNKFPDGLSITGSKETDFYFQYSLMYPPSMTALNKKIDSLAKNGFDVELSIANQQKNDILTKYKREFKQIILEHPSVFMAMSNINQRSDLFTADELQELISFVDSDLLKLPTGQKLIKFIEQSRLLQASKPFPHFEYLDVTGKKHSLATLKGSKGTLVIFWASWCGPCREEIPELKLFQKEMEGKGIKLVSISTDNLINAWKTAVKEEKMPWPNLSNLPGNYKEIGEKFNVRAIPAMFLLDSQNKIVLADPNNFELIRKEAKALVNK